MLNNKFVIGVYGHLRHSGTQESRVKALDSSYYLIHIFGDNGPIDFETLDKIYHEHYCQFININNCKHIGPFDGLEELNKYLYSLCDEMSLSKINIVSVEEYNLIIEKSSSVEELKNNLEDSSSYIECSSIKKNGLLGRLFS